MAIKVGQTRSLMFAQKSLVCSHAVADSAGLLAHLAFHELWTIRSSQRERWWSAYSISALAVCGAIFLILEMYQPYSGINSCLGALRCVLPWRSSASSWS